MVCPLCSGNDLEADWLKNEQRKEEKYFFCNNCELIFLDSSFFLSPEEEKRRYQQHDNSLKNQGYVSMFENFIDRAVMDFIVPPAKALDFGCGPDPVLAYLLKKRGFLVSHYDPFFYPRIKGDEGSFDLICSTEVLEHVFKPISVFKSFSKLLKAQGVLSLMTHLHPGWGKFPDWWYKRDPTHIVFFNRRTMEWIETGLPFRLLYCDGNKFSVFEKSEG